jgi:hypothetical protein
METRKIYLATFDMCSISYPANVNVIFEFFPCTPQLWLIDFGLWNSLSKGLCHQRLVDLSSNIPIGISRMEWGPEIYGANEWVLLVLSKLSALETPFSFDSDRSASGGWYVTINVADERLNEIYRRFRGTYSLHQRISSSKQFFPRLLLPPPPPTFTHLHLSGH